MEIKMTTNTPTPLNRHELQEAVDSAILYEMKRMAHLKLSDRVRYITDAAIKACEEFSHAEVRKQYEEFTNGNR